MNKMLHRRLLPLLLGSLLALSISACSSAVQTSSLPAPSEPVFSPQPPTAAVVPTVTRTSRPDPSPTPPSLVVASTATATESPAAFETRVAATNAAEFASYQATTTAVIQTLEATVAPRTFQSLPSPDGAHLAEITIFDCTYILPPSEMASSYEVLKVDGQLVVDQFLNCGGIGSAGLGGLFWSENSRFFYFTDAREGAPDGGGPWIRPISRYDTGTAAHEMLWMPVFSAGGRRVAGGQGTSLVVWDFEAGDLARFDFASSERAWVNAAAWSPDERAVAFAVQICPEGGCDAVLMLADLETMQVTELARLQNAQVNELSWPEPETIIYFDYNIFNGVEFDLGSGALATITPRPTSAVSPTPRLFPTATPFPTYAPDSDFPLEIYPFESPFRRPLQGSAMLVMGHGCPSLTGVESIAPGSELAPTAQTLDPLFDEVRSGDLTRLRAASDRAYWPISGLNVRRETPAWFRADSPLAPAAESPHAEALTLACGPDVLARSWWARINEGGSSNQDYFFIRRQGQWLVWSSIYSFE